MNNIIIIIKAIIIASYDAQIKYVYRIQRRYANFENNRTQYVIYAY